MYWLCPQHGWSICLQVVQQAWQVQDEPEAFFLGPSLEDALENLSEADSDGEAPTCRPYKQPKKNPIERCAADLLLAGTLSLHPAQAVKQQLMLSDLHLLESLAIKGQSSRTSTPTSPSKAVRTAVHSSPWSAGAALLYAERRERHMCAAVACVGRIKITVLKLAVSGGG